MNRQDRHFYEFGPFRVDDVERVLYREGRPVMLPPKVFDTLLVLVRESGHVVEKEELIKQVWPDTFVEENNLSQYISVIRRTLGDGRHEQRYIETVPRRGYRFAGDVREVWDGNGEVVSATHTKLSLVIREETEEQEDSETGGREEAEGGRRGETKAEAVLTPSPVSTSLRRSFSPVLMLVAIGLLAGALAAVLWARGRAGRDGDEAAPAAAAGFRSVAVLPFVTIGAGDAEEFLSLGMADALIQRLGRAERVVVRPTSAVQSFKSQTPLDTRDTLHALQGKVEAGRKLGVDLVLHGTLERAGGRVRGAAQLVNVRGMSPLWVERFDEEAGRIFAVQDRIAERVARTLSPNGTEPTQPARRHTANLDAYESYMMGLYLWNKRGPGDIARSVSFFREAIAKDPGYALAHAGLAAACSMGGACGQDTEALARRALELDPTLGEAHATIGFIKMFYHYRPEEAERDFVRAVELSPNYASAHQWLALCLAAQGRFEEAVARMNRALEIDPASLIVNADLAQVYYFAKDYERAAEQCHKVLDADPNFQVAREYLHRIYKQKGMHQEAFDEYVRGQRQLNLIPPDTLDALVRAYEADGIEGFWRAQTKRIDLSEWHHLALYHAYLGENDKALDWLRRSAETKRDGYWFVFVKVDPAFAALHSDPRFKELVRLVFPQEK